MGKGNGTTRMVTPGRSSLDKTPAWLTEPLTKSEQVEYEVVRNVYRLARTDYTDLDKMKAVPTESGDWLLTYEGKNVSVVRGRIIHESTLRKLRIL